MRCHPPVRDCLAILAVPLSPPPLCVAAADNVYGLGTNRMSEIKLNAVGWTEGLLIKT